MEEEERESRKHAYLSHSPTRSRLDLRRILLLVGIKDRMSDERWRRAHTDNTYAVCSFCYARRCGLADAFSLCYTTCCHNVTNTERSIILLHLHLLPRQKVISLYSSLGRLWKHLLPSTPLQQAGPSPTDPPPFFGSQPDIGKKKGTFAPSPSASLKPKHNYAFPLSLHLALQPLFILV